FEHVIAAEEIVACSVANVERARIPTNAVCAAFEQKLFIALGRRVEAELKRRRAAVQYEDGSFSHDLRFRVCGLVYSALLRMRAFLELLFGRLRRAFLWPRPRPIRYLRAVDPFGVGVVDGLDDLVLEPPFDVCGGVLQARHAIADVDGEVESVDLIDDRQLERRVDVAFLLIAANMDVVVISAAVRELVNQRGVAVEVED